MKLTVNDFSKIIAAKTPAGYKSALDDLIAKKFALQNFSDEAAAVIEQVKKLKRELIELAERKKKIKSGNESSSASGRGDEKNWLPLIRASVTRIGVVGFFVYFIALLTNLYRYVMRLSAFYYARADVLTLKTPHDIDFALLTDKIAPDSLAFGKQPQLPVDKMVELTRDLMKITGARSK